MAVEPFAPPRTTYRSMRVSVLLILITVGVPGCVSGAGATRAPSDRYPTTGPTASADPVPAESGPRPHPDTSDAGSDPHSKPAGGSAAGHRGPDRAAGQRPTGGTWASLPKVRTSDPPAAVQPMRREHRRAPWRRLSTEGSPGTSDPAARPDAAKVPRDDDAVPARNQAGAAGRVVPVDQRSGSPPAAERLPEGYRRSLACSGLLGLVISAVGLAMVGYRRRCW
ncbi:hypothetical protein I0C86_24825 [Plantactinospora sp. S1510]|uniref:Translation initiation factor 2 n=1 Tax=Plantactinospora alkalitolerans TaxID=2789879 RepID=A0ABS0H1X2_9ACTN|nr:hypothetical protein [Plantactinospora alkalitolerans]MBF9132147.1 hypothetical protein [Plantactinospora alkalitolerans]